MGTVPNWMTPPISLRAAAAGYDGLTMRTWLGAPGGPAGADV